MEIEFKPYRLDWYVDKINRGEKFSFVRYGDGEITGILNPSLVNVDGHRWDHKGLQEDLIFSLKKRSRFYRGVWDFSTAMMYNTQEQLQAVVDKYEIKPPFHRGNIFWEGIQDGTILNFIEAIEKKQVVLIGSKSNELLPIKRSVYVAIPDLNCYLAGDQVKKFMKDYSEQNDDVVFILMASVASNCWAARLFNSIGDRCWMIDVGSIFDPLVGRFDRTAYRKSPQLFENIQKQLRGKSTWQTQLAI